MSKYQPTPDVPQVRVVFERVFHSSHSLFVRLMNDRNNKQHTTQYPFIMTKVMRADEGRCVAIDKKNRGWVAGASGDIRIICPVRGDDDGGMKRKEGRRVSD